MTHQGLVELLLPHLQHTVTNPPEHTAGEIADALIKAGLTLEPSEGSINILGLLEQPLDHHDIRNVLAAAGVNVQRIVVGELGAWRTAWTAEEPST